MDFQDKLNGFAAMLEAGQLRNLVVRGVDCESNRLNCKVAVKPGPKYTKVDVGSSGKYMVENATEKIFGIKAYGVIHRGHQYGTLETIDQWNWDDYTASTRRS